MSFKSTEESGLPNVSKQHHRGLRLLADRNGRTMRGQVEFLIKQACSAQGIDISRLNINVSEKSLTNK